MKFASFILILGVLFIAESIKIHNDEVEVVHDGAELFKQVKKLLAQDPEIKAKIDANETHTPEFNQLATKKISEIVKSNPDIQKQFVQQFGQSPFGKTLSEEDRTKVVSWMAANPDLVQKGKFKKEIGKQFPDIKEKFLAWRKANPRKNKSTAS